MPKKKMKYKKLVGQKVEYVGGPVQYNIPSNKPHKSKISMIQDEVFEIGSVKHAAQFTKSLLNVPDYIQIKNNNDVVEASHLFLTTLRNQRSNI